LRGSIIAQDRRECLAKIGTNPPLAIRTAEVEEAPMSQKLREISLAKLQAKYLTHKQIDEAREKRVPQFLKTKEHTHADEFRQLDVSTVSVQTETGDKDD
jgi:hypothetical protein